MGRERLLQGVAARLEGVEAELPAEVERDERDDEPDERGQEQQAASAHGRSRIVASGDAYDDSCSSTRRTPARTGADCTVTGGSAMRSASAAGSGISRPSTGATTSPNLAAWAVASTIRGTSGAASVAAAPAPTQPTAVCGSAM